MGAIMVHERHDGSMEGGFVRFRISPLCTVRGSFRGVAIFLSDQLSEPQSEDVHTYGGGVAMWNTSCAR